MSKPRLPKACPKRAFAPCLQKECEWWLELTEDIGMCTEAAKGIALFWLWDNDNARMEPQSP